MTLNPVKKYSEKKQKTAMEQEALAKQKKEQERQKEIVREQGIIEKYIAMNIKPNYINEEIEAAVRIYEITEIDKEFATRKRIEKEVKGLDTHWRDDLYSKWIIDETYVNIAGVTEPFYSITDVAKDYIKDLLPKVKAYYIKKQEEKEEKIRKYFNSQFERDGFDNDCIKVALNVYETNKNHNFASMDSIRFSELNLDHSISKVVEELCHEEVLKKNHFQIGKLEEDKDARIRDGRIWGSFYSIADEAKEPVKQLYQKSIELEKPNLSR